MKFVEYREQVKSLQHGKKLPTAIYLHRSAIESVLSVTLLSYIFDTINKLNITEPWNLLKLYKRDFKITLLNYPDFDTYAYPALHTSITIDLEEQTKRKANYQKSDNPPILHRKETFVLANYPLIESFKVITAEGEAIELYKNTKTIGFCDEELCDLAHLLQKSDSQTKEAIEKLMHFTAKNSVAALLHLIDMQFTLEENTDELNKTEMLEMFLQQCGPEQKAIL